MATAAGTEDPDGGRCISDEDRGERQGGADDIPFWEWVVAAIGVVLVVGSLGFVMYTAVTKEPSPPEIVVKAWAVIPAADGYLVRVLVVNRGGSTAKGVVVEGELKNGPTSIETSETTLDYVPSHSERKGGLFFTKDPRRFELQLRAKGYEQP